MKRVTLIMMLIMGVHAARAQNVVYDANAEIRSVTTFNGINVTGSVSLYLSQGTETGVAVSAQDEKYNSKIKTEVRDGILHISVEGGMWNSFSLANKKLKAYVSITTLRQLHVAGASNVMFTGKLTGDDLTMVILGASDIKGPVQLKNLSISISGASVVRLTGTAESATISANGAARINGFDLQVDKGKFDLSGASHITISVNKELTANASGGSTIQYRGDALATSINTNGGASIQKKSNP